MRLAPAIGIFFTEGDAEITGIQIVLERRTNPLCAGMIDVCGFVGFGTRRE